MNSDQIDEIPRKRRYFTVSSGVLVRVRRRCPPRLGNQAKETRSLAIVSNNFMSFNPSARNISKGVGYWTRDEASARTEARAIGKWAEERGCDGVVWTALQPRFAGVYRFPSEPEVVGYLASLTGRVRAEAETYCRRAPTQIRTPYRATIEARLGWIPEPEGQVKP
jgi:hypothetical protein